jgi:hypothetical protein
MVTSSPTRIPPVSRAAFRVKPKSLRLILVLAEIPIRVFPQGILGRRRWPFHRKPDLARHPADGQVAFHRQFSIAHDSEARGLGKAHTLAAFDDLVKQFERRLLNVATRITKNREDAEDVVQEAFLKVFKNIDGFRAGSKFPSG